MGDVDGEAVALMKLGGDLIRLSATQIANHGGVSLSLGRDGGPDLSDRRLETPTTGLPSQH